LVDHSTVASLCFTEYGVDIKLEEIALRHVLSVDSTASGLIDGVVAGVVGFITSVEICHPPVKVVATTVSNTNS